jgi:2-hydroxy-6-oxonona-2,4-dienedioate hydrolase
MKTMSQNIPLTEASTSKFADIKEGDLALRIHYNDMGEGEKIVVMLHGSGQEPVAGPISTGTLSR